MADLIRLKRGQSSTWKTKNLLLKEGEPGVELDTHKLKIGDGKTLWNDLPYVGNGGSAVIPDNLVKYLGTIDTLPETAEDGSLCIYQKELYLYDKKWIPIITSSDGQKKFNSLVEAINYVNANDCIGLIVSIFQNNKWLPYIVDINNELVPINSEEVHFDILNGGNANTLN